MPVAWAKMTSGYFLAASRTPSMYPKLVAKMTRHPSRTNRSMTGTTWASGTLSTYRVSSHGRAASAFFRPTSWA